MSPSRLLQLQVHCFLIIANVIAQRLVRWSRWLRPLLFRVAARVHPGVSLRSIRAGFAARAPAHPASRRAPSGRALSCTRSPCAFPPGRRGKRYRLRTGGIGRRVDAEIRKVLPRGERDCHVQHQPLFAGIHVDAAALVPAEDGGHPTVA